MNWIVKNFLRGLVIVVPVAVTIWVIVRAFNAVDRLVGFKYPGIGFVVIVGGTLLVGVLASNFIGRRFVALTHAIFNRAPLVRIIYASIKDLLEAFVGDQKRFDRPVAVSINDGVMTLGFMTQDDLSFLAMPERVLVQHVGNGRDRAVVACHAARCRQRERHGSDRERRRVARVRLNSRYCA